MAACAGLLQAQEISPEEGAARDMLYQALELLSSKSARAQVQSAISLFRGALDQYPSFGDAFYYRQLCLKRLDTDPQRQKLDLEAAQRYDSEAFRDQRDPFKLAVPRIYENLGAVGQKYALVVGISEFATESPLKAADADAKAFADALRDPAVGRFAADQVTLLVNVEATTAKIKERLNRIARLAKPEDLVVLYFATHGSGRSQDHKQVSYLITHDTDVRSRDLIFATALPMVEISSILSSRCVAQRTVAIFDTCHSGAAAPGQALAIADMDRLREGAGRYVISSCEADQLAYEANGSGFFTASLVKNLRERKGCIRLSELFQRVQADVKSTLEQAGKQQRPVMATSDAAAEIVLGAAVGQAQESCSA
jgi:hypothetical protein